MDISLRKLYKMVKDREASGVTAHGVTKSQRWLSHWTRAIHITIFLISQMVNTPSAMQETPVQCLGQEDSPGEGNGNLLQYSCLENTMDRGSWWAIVHGVTKSWTWLSYWHLKNWALYKTKPNKWKVLYSSFQWRPLKARLKEPEKPIKRLPETKIKDYRFFPGGSDGKVSACNAGDPVSIPGSGRSPGGGNGNPLQYSCLENSMDGGAWWATVHGVAKSWTWLSDFTHFTHRLKHTHTHTHTHTHKP